MKKHVTVYTIDYYAYRSPLRKWNPMFKLFFSFFVLVLCLLSGHMAVSLYSMAAMAALTVIKGKVSLREYMVLLLIPATFILLSGCAIAVEMGKNQQGWYLIITEESLMRSLSISLKALGAVSALYMLALSTPVHEIVGVLQKLKIPKVMVELMNLMYRYVFILSEVQRQIKTAAECRLGYRDFRTSCHTFGNSLGSLFLIAMKKAGHYYDAMEARCYEGELQFLGEEKPIHKGGLAIAGLLIGGMLVVWYFCERRGFRL